MRKIRRNHYRVGGFIRDKNCFVGQTGYQASKYCTFEASYCFGYGQDVYVKFNPTFRTIPKVMIGLTLVDTDTKIKTSAFALE
jgi:hypothetical protein